MYEQKFFETGRPTGADVDSIIKAFPIESLKADTMLAYGDIASVIKENAKSSRFRTVCMSWRKRLYRDHNVRVGAVPSLGFKVLNNSDRIHESSKGVSCSVRKIKKMGKLAVTTPEEGLTEEDRRTRNYVIIASGSIATMEGTERKKLVYKVQDVSDKN